MKNRIYICGEYEVDNHKSCGLSHMIRIVDTGDGNLRPSWFEGEYLQLCFGDVFSEQDAIDCKTQAPNLEVLQRALDFTRKAFAGVEAKILFSCGYGASRSPALALVVLTDYLGAGSEKESLRHIIEIRPCAVPNSFVVKLGDVLLQRKGALRSSLDEFNKEIMDFCSPLIA